MNFSSKCRHRQRCLRLVAWTTVHSSTGPEISLRDRSAALLSKARAVPLALAPLHAQITLLFCSHYSEFSTIKRCVERLQVFLHPSDDTDTLAAQAEGTGRFDRYRLLRRP